MDDAVCPSLLSIHHPPTITLAWEEEEPNKMAKIKRYSHKWLLELVDKPKVNGKSKLIVVLQKKKTNDTPGWLCQIELANGKGHLDDTEKTKAMALLFACKAHNSTNPLVAFAWGTTACTIWNFYNKMKTLDTQNSIAWKQHSNSGKNLLNLQAKQEPLAFVLLGAQQIYVHYCTD